MFVYVRHERDVVAVVNNMQMKLIKMNDVVARYTHQVNASQLAKQYMFYLYIILNIQKIVLDYSHQGSDFVYCAGETLELSAFRGIIILYCWGYRNSYIWHNTTLNNL